MLKTILTGFILGLVLILAVPATLILASWNAVPGDSSYKIKVGLEKTILGVAPSDNLKTTLEIKYTERRFNEVEKLIETDIAKPKLVDESLANLTNQAIASKNSLQKIQNVEEKTVQTENLIATLESISVKIEEKKQTSNITSVPTKIPTKVPTNTPVPENISIIRNDSPVEPTSTKIPTPTLTPIPTKKNEPVENITSDVKLNLEDTQQKINEIIVELKESSNESSSDHNKNSSKRDKNNSSNEDNQEKNSRDKNDRRP